jgi:hypothetical protein
MSVRKSMAMLLLMLAAIFTISGCYLDNINCIRGNGQVTTETRATQPFNQIVSNGSFEIVVLPSLVHEVRLETESNLIDFIRTDVAGNRLIIETSNNRCVNNTLPLRITVYSPYVNGFEMNGSGSMVAYGLDVAELSANLNGSGTIDLDAVADVVRCTISGSGTIEISGVTDISELQISGSGTIYGYDLDQNACYATITGSGNMYVYPNLLLDVEISGSGNLYYKGNPQLIQKITGSGRVIRQ